MKLNHENRIMNESKFNMMAIALTTSCEPY